MYINISLENFDLKNQKPKSQFWEECMDLSAVFAYLKLFQSP